MRLPKLPEDFNLATPTGAGISKPEKRYSICRIAHHRRVAQRFRRRWRSNTCWRSSRPVMICIRPFSTPSTCSLNGILVLAAVSWLRQSWIVSFITLSPSILARSTWGKSLYINPTKVGGRRIPSVSCCGSTVSLLRSEDIKKTVSDSPAEGCLFFAFYYEGRAMI